jgi:DNA-binding IclR family transcriptional regulator
MRQLVSQALPHMRRFAHDAQQSTHLVGYDRGSCLVIGQVDAPGYWGMAIRVGSHISLLNTGSGHILLAFAGDTERHLMLEERKVIPHEIWPDELDSQLTDVRERGYEMMHSQQTTSVTNISVPLIGPAGTVLAALTCPHLERLDIEDALSTDDILAMLQETARDISVTASGAE